MTCYATVAEAKSYMTAEATTDDALLLGIIRQISNRIDRQFYKRPAPLFAPVIETRNQYRLTPYRINSWEGTYRFGEPLLALSSVIAGTTTLTVGTDVELWQGDVSPYMTLALIRDDCCGSWYRYAECTGCNARNTFITIGGTWGYHTDYSNAWIDTLQDVPVGGITNSATSFTVSDVDGTNSLGLTPAMSAGNLLQIDSEWLEVTATNTSTNTVTVRRGVNGSTAAAHSAGTVIYSYVVEPCIMRAVARQAGLQYAKNGAYDNQTVQDLTAVTFAADVLAEYSALLSLFANM